MKHSFGLWQLVGFATTSLFGTLLHFLYDATGGALMAAPFSGVNESTFEHMKLFFWPALLFAIIESHFFKEERRFFPIKLRGILLGLTLIPVLFYTYNGVIGKSPDWVKIAIFFIAAAAAYIYEARLYGTDRPHRSHKRLALAVLFILALMFVVFTFRAPEIGLFQDPITGRYGI